MTITLSGSNDFLLNEQLNQYKKEYLDFEELETSQLDLKGLKINLLNMSLFGERRCIVLRRPSELQAFKDDISEIINNLPSQTILIIIEPNLDKRSTYYKVLKKDTDFKEFESLEFSKLQRWVRTYVQQQGGSISVSDANLLLTFVGDDQFLIQNELDKLLTYDLGITKSNIELLVDPLPSSTIFELLDASLCLNFKKAFKIYDSQRSQKIEPESILGMFIWQLHIIALIKTYKGDLNELNNNLALKPFVIQKALNLSKNFSITKLKELITYLKEADINSKTKNTSLDEYLKNFLIKTAFN